MFRYCSSTSRCLDSLIVAVRGSRPRARPQRAAGAMGGGSPRARPRRCSSSSTRRREPVRRWRHQQGRRRQLQEEASGTDANATGRQRLLAPVGKWRVAGTRRTEPPHMGCTEEREYGDMGASACFTSFAGDLWEAVG
jgi:hypothetical protein